VNIETAMNEQNLSTDWTNFLEVRAYGLMRSGNHAIIEWLQNQFAGEITCFLNNVKHGDHDPYSTYEQRVLTGIENQIDIETLRRTRKRLLVYSYEDRHELKTEQKTFHESVFQLDFEKKRRLYLGASEHQIDVLIIRDPFNFFASRMKLIHDRGPQGGVSDLALILKNWKALAREAIKLTQAPESGKIMANFNRWVADLAYRQSLSGLLMGTFTDSSMRSVPEYGGGSSFQDSDKLTIRMIMARWQEVFNIKRYARLGHYWKRLITPDRKEKVFERWKHLAEHDKFRALFFDGELLALSEELFGEIPGTREFVNSIKK
jgi:hypothetical protein